MSPGALWLLAGILLPQACMVGQAPATTPVKNQDPEPAKPRMAVDEEGSSIAFSMGEKAMPLLEFIKWGQEVTGKRFTLSPEALQRTRADDSAVRFLGTFRIQRKRFAADFFSFFQTMLYVKGLAVEPRGEGDQQVFEIVEAVAGGEQRGQDQPQAGAVPEMVVDEAADTISFSLGGKEMALIDFVKWGQQVTGKRFTFRATALRPVDGADNAVKLLGTFRLARKDFAEQFFVFFQTILHTKGFTVAQRGEGDQAVHEIVSLTAARDR